MPGDPLHQTYNLGVCSIITHYHIKITTTSRMLQAANPQLSSPSKCNLLSLASPTRNKRVVSVQCCSSLQTNRNNSCRKLDSPSKPQPIKSRKKSQIGHVKTKSKDFVVQINALKEQYLSLKIAYRQLAAEKVKQSHKEQLAEEQSRKAKLENQKLARQNQNLNGKVHFLESQVDRIKRESIKLVQVWQFRVKAVEENLAQKERIIANLRECLMANGIAEPRSSTKLPSSPKQNKDDLMESISALNDSLAMTHLKGTNLSNMSQELNLSSESKDQTMMFETVSHRILQVSANVNTDSGFLVDITNQGEEAGKKAEKSFKKIKKQPTKRMEVNVEEKHREPVSLIQPKTPMDRKTGKQSKIPKIKLKRDEDYIESKSSKKKMSAR